MTFDEQVDAILQAMPRRHRIAFLAGVRFTQGHAEYGAELFAKSLQQLVRDEREEHADAFTYRCARRFVRRRMR